MLRCLKNSKADIIQYRDKQSKKSVILHEVLAIKKALKNKKKLFIINDYLDIAKIVDADGVHLGQEDASVETARQILGKDKIIGLSCHNLKQVRNAESKNVDYLGIGPIFPTKTKTGTKKTLGLGIFKQLKLNRKIPIFAIGGINLGNIDSVIQAGAKRVAVSRVVLSSKNISFVINTFLKSFN